MSTISIPVTKTTQSKLSETDFSSLVFGKSISDHMFVADYQNGAWGDFRIVPYGPMEIYPGNATLHYGQAIFEGLKAYKNEKGEVLVFRAEANAKRLNESAARMCMPQLPESVFLEALKQLLSLDRDWVPQGKGSSLYIRPFMFAMDNYLGVKASDSYRFMIFTRVGVRPSRRRVERAAMDARKTTRSVRLISAPSVQETGRIRASRLASSSVDPSSKVRRYFPLSSRRTGNPPTFSGRQKWSYAASASFMDGGRGDATQGHIGTFVVVRPEPARRRFLNGFNAVEERLREPVVAHGPIVAFDVGVLLGLTRLDAVTPNAARLGPLLDGFTDVLGTVVAANDGRDAAPFNQLIEGPDDADGG